MNRAYALLASLILIATPMAGCLSGEDLEELVDDVLGCMDENAANYEENATAELVGDCIYMATTETFIEAMTDMGSIEDMLEESPKAGYSQSISSSEWNQDLGMQMDVEIEDIVMADLDNDSVYIHNSISIVGLLQMEYTHVQVGEVVNIHLLVGGMMVQGEATTGSYQTRDATPNVLEVIAEQAGLFNEGGLFNDGDDDDGDDDDSDLPEDAVITITMSDDMETQTMTMEYTEGGAEIIMTIHIDQNQDLMSMSMETENGSATSSITYEVMWGDAIVIEVDETLPKTSIPVWLDSEIFNDVNDHDDHGDDDSEEMFPCDGGNTWIPWDWVNDGHEDCEDGSDEYDDDDHHDDGNHISWNSYYDGYCEWEGNPDDVGEDRWSCEEDASLSDWHSWWYYCELHYEDWFCTDDYGQDPDYENSADNGNYNESNASEEDPSFVDGMNWELYPRGYCEWEGNSDDGEDRWSCKSADWENWWYYCEHHDSDWHCTDDFGQSEEFEHSADNDEWSGSEDGEDGHDDGHDDDDGPPSPEDAMNMTDADGDGYMSQDEFVTYWNNENSDAPIDSDQSFLTTEDVEDLIELCDYDAPSDLIDINEMQCFIDNLVGMMPDDENTPSLDDFFNHFDTDGDGHLTATEFIDANDVPDEDQNGVHDMFDMYDNDESGGLDYYEFEPLYDMMVDNDDGDDGDDDGDGMERNDATGFVAENQTLNAPITDFEVHFLSDCEEEYDEEEDQMIQPDLSACTNEFSIPLNGGEAEGVTITYTDHDGDGLVSPGDEMSVEWGDYDGEEIDKMEIYDTYASQYSSESAAMPPVLPGFGAILGALALLGAAIASRRD